MKTALIVAAVVCVPTLAYAAGGPVVAGTVAFFMQVATVAMNAYLTSEVPRIKRDTADIKREVTANGAVIREHGERLDALDGGKVH